MFAYFFNNFIEIYLFINFLILFGYSFVNFKFYKKHIFIKNMFWIFIQILIMIIFLIMYDFQYYNILYNDFYILDNVSQFIPLTLFLINFFFFLTIYRFIKIKKIYFFEIFFIMLIYLFTSFFLINSINFFGVYLAIELQGFCLYILISLNRFSSYNIESSLKYLILGALASSVLLFGITIIFSIFGSLNYEYIFQYLNSQYIVYNVIFKNEIILNTLITFSIICIISSLLFKIVGAPFHIWAPDIYDGASYFMTVFLLIIPKILILIITLRICYLPFNEFYFIWKFLILFSAVFSLILSSISVLIYKKVKKILIYSSIGHVGFILISLSLGTFESIESIFLYFFVYVIINFIFWGIFINNFKVKTNNIITYITELTNFKNNNMLLAFTLSFAMLSLAGIPPLIGFYSKMFVLLNAIKFNSYFAVFVAIFSSMISCFYYLRFVKVCFFENKKNYNYFYSISKEFSLVLSFFLFLVLFLFLNPKFVFSLIFLLVSDILFI